MQEEFEEQLRMYINGLIQKRCVTVILTTVVMDFKKPDSFGGQFSFVFYKMLLYDSDYQIILF